MKRFETAGTGRPRHWLGILAATATGVGALLAQAPDAGTADAASEGRRVEELVNVFDNSYLKPGWKAGVAVTVFGNARIEGEVEDVCVTVFGNAVVAGRVGQECVAVFGNLDLNGEVGGDLVVFMGDARLGPQAVVHGETIVIGGKVHAAPGATLHGQKLQLAGFLPAIGEWFRSGLFLGRPIAPGVGWVWGVVAVHFLLYLLAAALLPRPVEAVEGVLDRQTLAAFGVGLLGLILGAPLSLVLVASGVGLLVLPLLMVALMVALWLGKAATFQWMGRSLCRRFNPAGTCPPLPGFVVGFGLVTLLYLVPGVGFVVYGLLVPLAFGAVLLAMFETLRAGQAPPAPLTAAAAPSPGTAPLAGAPPASVPSAPPAPDIPPDLPPKPHAAAPALALPVLRQPAASADRPPREALAASTPALPEPGKAPAPSAGAEPEVPSAASLLEGASPPPPPPPSPPQAAVPPPQPPPLPPRSPAASGSGSAGLSAAELATLPRAGFWLRAGAAVLDLILLAWLLAPLPGALPGPLLVVGLIAYHTAFWAWKGTTLGGIVCGLKVVRLDGRPLDWQVALVRALAAVFSALPLGLGFFWAGWSADRQSWHDKIAGTVIVKARRGEPLI